MKDTDDVNDGLMPEKTEEPDVKTESDKGQQTGSKNESCLLYTSECNRNPDR